MDPSNPKHPLYLAQIQRKVGKVDEARASLLRAATLDPSLGIAWGVLADIALQEGDLSVARTHIGRARAAEPASAQWRLIEARILRRSGDPESALRLLRSLPDDELLDDPAMLNEAALSYGMLSRPGDAASLYVQASGRRPEDAQTAFEAAVWLERAGRLDDATKFAQAAVRLGSTRAKDMAERLGALR